MTPTTKQNPAVHGGSIKSHTSKATLYGMTCDGKPIDISGMVTIKDLSVGNFQFQRDEDELMDVCWVRHNERLVFEFTASCFDSSKRPPESIVAELSRFIVEHGFKPVGELEWNGKNWIQKAEKYS